MKTRSSYLLLAAGALALVGCGGGSSPSRATRGAIKMTIHWPEAKSRLIPIASNSIGIEVDAGNQKLASQVVPRPPQGTNVSTVQFDNLTAGNVVVSAGAFPTNNGTGTAQAAGSINATVVSGQTITTPDLVMNTTIKRITVTPVTVAVAATAQATASAFDASNNLVLTTPSQISWTVTGTVASVTSPGNPATVTGFATGGATLSATDSESHVTGTGALTVTPGSTLDPSRIIVADHSNNRIVGLDTIPATSFLTQFVYNPTSIATDAQGRIYVASYAPGSAQIIRMDDLNGTNFVAYHPAGSTASVVAVDKLGRIYFRDDNSALNRIDDISGAGLITYNPTNSFGGHLFNAMSGIATDSQNRIYVLLLFGNKVIRIDDMTGAGWTEFGTTGSGVGQLKSPSTLAIDSQDRIYVADAGNHRVVRFDDMAGTNWAEFAIPSEVGSTNTSNDAVAVDHTANPHVYFADSLLGIVYRMDDMAGTSIVHYGADGNGNGQFHFPGGLAIK